MKSKEATCVTSLSSSIRKLDIISDNVKGKIKWLEGKHDKESLFHQLLTSKDVSKRINEEMGEICAITTSFDVTITEDKTLPSLLDQLSGLVHQDVTDSEELLEKASEDYLKKKMFLKIKSCTVIKEKDPKVRSDKATLSITGCCWLPDNKGVIICDNSEGNQTIKVFDEDMNVKFTAKCSSRSYDVAFIDEKSAVVTLPCAKAIQYIEVKPGFMFKDMKKLNVSCRGVNVHGKKIFLCVDESSSVKGIKVLTLTGNDVSFIPHIGPGTPRKLCLHPDGKMYYTSGCGNDVLINCLTIDGHVLFSVSSNDLDFPAGITSDGDGNVLVCDENKKCVKVISSAGLCGDFVLTNTKYEPRAMCMNKSHDILAIAFKNINSPCDSKLTFYKLEYS